MTLTMKQRPWLIGLICLGLLLGLAAAGTAVVLSRNEAAMELNVAGAEVITLEYGQSYTEPGATAFYSESILMPEGRDVPVEIRSEVDAAKIGTYHVRYIAEYDGFIRTSIRTVHIVDTQAPVIELTANPETFTFPGSAYQEEGFTARDNYDGDITQLVQRVEENGQVIYSVTDSSGNSTTVTRQIVYDDPVPPVLTLQGDAKVTISGGREFVDPGFTATDNCDGDLTDQVVVTHDIDVWKPGTYQVHYSVSDSYGNTVTASREVVVKKLYYTGGTNGCTIYLTFDDGPCAYTTHLLDVLKKYGVKATFFVVGKNNLSITSRMVAEGHAVGIHSVTHKYGEIYASEEAYFNDLYTMQAMLEPYIGYKTNLVRFPGGSSNTVSSFNPGIMTRLTQQLTEKGFYYFDWNVGSGDTGSISSEDQVFENVIKDIGDKKTAVVLQHDIKYFSVMAVEKIIIWGIQNGYSFDVLTPDIVMHHRVNN